MSSVRLSRASPGQVVKASAASRCTCPISITYCRHLLFCVSSLLSSALCCCPHGEILTMNADAAQTDPDAITYVGRTLLDLALRLSGNRRKMPSR